MTGAARFDAAMPPDPFRLPATFVSAAGAVTLDRGMAMVTRRIAGLPVTLRVPFGSFSGVQVRLELAGERLVGHVELRHRDPALVLALGEELGVEDAALAWRAWAKALELPMLLVESDGTVRPLEESARRPFPRRMSGFLRTRRPRFLTRRKLGSNAAMPVLRGREIASYE